MNDESDTERRQVKFQDKKFEVCKKLGISKNLYERKTDLERRFNNNRTAFNQQIHEFLKNITVKSGKNHEVKYNSLIIDLLDKIRPLEDTQAAHQAQDLNKLGSAKQAFEKLMQYKKVLTAATEIVDAGVRRWKFNDYERDKSQSALTDLRKMVSYVDYTSRREVNFQKNKRFDRFSKNSPKDSSKDDFETIMPEESYVKIMAMNNANLAMNELINVMCEEYVAKRGVATIFGNSRLFNAISVPFVTGMSRFDKRKMEELQLFAIYASQKLSVEVIPELIEMENWKESHKFELVVIHMVYQIMTGLNVIQRNLGYFPKFEKTVEKSYELDPMGTDSDDEWAQIEAISTL